MKKNFMFILVFVNLIFSCGIVAAFGDNEIMNFEEIVLSNNIYPHDIIVYDAENKIEIHYDNEIDIIHIMDKIKNIDFKKSNIKHAEPQWFSGERLHIKYADSLDMVVTIYSNGFLCIDNVYTKPISRLTPPTATAVYTDSVKIVIDDLIMSGSINGYKNAKLVVNNEDITKDKYVKIGYTDAYIPFRAVLEGLGECVQWDSQNKVVKFSCNGKQYILNPQNVTLKEKDTGDNLLLTLSNDMYYYCEIIENRVIVNDNVMRVICRLIDGECKIDYDNLIINITV